MMVYQFTPTEDMAHSLMLLAYYSLELCGKALSVGEFVTIAFGAASPKSKALFT